MEPKQPTRTRSKNDQYGRQPGTVFRFEKWLAMWRKQSTIATLDGDDTMRTSSRWRSPLPWLSTKGQGADSSQRPRRSSALAIPAKTVFSAIRQERTIRLCSLLPESARVQVSALFWHLFVSVCPIPSTAFPAYNLSVWPQDLPSSEWGDALKRWTPLVRDPPVWCVILF